MPVLDATGLSIETTLEILEDLETRIRDALGQEIETGPNTPLGQVLSIFADSLRQVQEALAAVYNATYRGSASGAALDRIGALTGSVRLPATASRASVDVTLTAPVNLTPGQLVIQVSGQPDRLFANELDIIEAGAGTYSHPFVCQETGPIEAPAGTLTVIPVPVAGVSSVTNPADADLGREVETDTAYRVRQEQELSRPASATVDGIRVDVLDGVLDDNEERLIEDARVFENVLDITDSTGLPPHSVEVVIWDGSPPAALDVDVGQAVWDAKPGGIQAYGTTSTTATDSRGDSRSVSFTRATQKVLVLEIDITAGSEYTTGPDSTESRIESALVAFWDATQRIGQDLIRSQLYDPIWDAVERNAEISDIVEIRASISPAAPVASNVSIGVREIGTLATTEITIISV